MHKLGLGKHAAGRIRALTCNYRYSALNSNAMHSWNVRYREKQRKRERERDLCSLTAANLNRIVGWGLRTRSRRRVASASVVTVRQMIDFALSGCGSILQSEDNKSTIRYDWVFICMRRNICDVFQSNKLMTSFSKANRASIQVSFAFVINPFLMTRNLSIFRVPSDWIESFAIESNGFQLESNQFLFQEIQIYLFFMLAFNFNWYHFCITSSQSSKSFDTSFHSIGICNIVLFLSFLWGLANQDGDFN